MRSKFIALWLLTSIIFSSCTTQTEISSISEKKATETIQHQVSTEAIIPSPTNVPKIIQTKAPTIIPTNVPTITPTKSPEVITEENASRLEKFVTIGHGSTWNKAAISPDHKTIAVASTIGVILYDTETLEQIKILETKQTTQSVIFSPDGTKLAIGMPNPLILEDKKERITSVEIWDIKSGEQIYRFEGYKQIWDIMAIIFSNDGCEVIDWSDTVHNICNNNSSKKMAKDWRNPAAVLSPDGSQALIYQGGWGVWDIQQNKKIRDIVLRASLEFEGHYIVDGLPIYSPDGKNIASWQADRIFITDSQDFKQIGAYKLDAKVKALYFSPNNQYLVAFGGDNKIYLLSAVTGEVIGETDVLPFTPLAVTFSADDKYLTSLDDFTNLYQWSIPSLKIVKQRTFLPFTSQAAFSPDGNYLAITTRVYSHISEKYSPSTVEVLNAKTLEHVYTLEGWEPDPKGGIFIGGLAFSPDGQILATPTSPLGHVYLWDMGTGKLLRKLEVAPGKKLKDSDLIGFIEGVGFSPDGKTLAVTNAYMGRLLLWNLETGELTQNYPLPKYKYIKTEEAVHPQKVTFNKDGSQVLFNDIRKAWDLNEKKYVDWQNSNSSYPIDALKRYTWSDQFEFNPDKTVLIQSSKAGVVNLWHIKP